MQSHELFYFHLYKFHTTCTVHTVGVLKKFLFRFIYCSVLLPFLHAAFKMLPCFVTVLYTVSTLYYSCICEGSQVTEIDAIIASLYEASPSLLIVSDTTLGVVRGSAEQQTTRL